VASETYGLDQDSDSPKGDPEATDPTGLVGPEAGLVAAASGADAETDHADADQWSESSVEAEEWSSADGEAEQWSEAVRPEPWSGTGADSGNWPGSDVVEPVTVATDEGSALLLPPVRAQMHRESAMRYLLAAADAMAALLAVTVWAQISGTTWRWDWLAVGLVAVLIAKMQGLYDRDDRVLHKSTLGEWRVLVRASVLSAIMTYLIWYASTSPESGRGIRPFFFFAIVTFVLTVPGRALARSVALSITLPERCLIVGDGDVCDTLARRVQEVPHTDLVGMVAADDIDESIEGISELVRALGVQRILIGPYPSSLEEKMLAVITSAKWLGVRVSLMPNVMTVLGVAAVFDELDSLILLGVPRFGLSRSSGLLKRTFDLVVGGVTLLACLPLMLAVAIAVKLDSPGPVLFKQRRIGRDGKPFTILKFRSMVDHAERLRGQLESGNESIGLFKISGDPRITRVGRLIRKTYVDELPQLFNVLRGEMSLVGPRPLIESEDALLSGVARHRSRLTPGMTGPWQLRGPIEASLADLSRLDYLYASNWTVWADVDILVGTAVRVLNRRGH